VPGREGVSELSSEQSSGFPSRLLKARSLLSPSGEEKSCAARPLAVRIAPA
jgi:hypothetical protein